LQTADTHEELREFLIVNTLANKINKRKNFVLRYLCCVLCKMC